MSFLTRQAEGRGSVIVKSANQGFSVPDGQMLTVTSEADDLNYNVQLTTPRGTLEGTAKKANLVQAGTSQVIAANPSPQFQTVYMWPTNGGPRFAIQNGTVLQVIRMDINKDGTFFIVIHNGQEYSVKRENVKEQLASTGLPSRAANSTSQTGYSAASPPGIDAARRPPNPTASISAPASAVPPPGPAPPGRAQAARPPGPAPPGPVQAVPMPYVSPAMPTPNVSASPAMMPAANASSSGGIFVSSQVNKATEQIIFSLTQGQAVKIKASMPPFNRKGNGKLPSWGTGDYRTEEIDAPAFGVRIGEAILEILDNDDIRRLSAQLNIGIPAKQLNTKVQETLAANIQGFKHDMGFLLPLFCRANAGAMNRLEMFAGELAQLTPDAPQVASLEAWDAFVRRFVSAEWQHNLHMNDVLLSFGFTDDSVNELNSKLAHMGEDPNLTKHKEHIERALSWFSKALAGYGWVGSLADIVNLAFAMTNTPASAKQNLTEDMMISVLSQFKTQLANLSPSSPTSLWIPNIMIHDCEMCDMLALLILRYAHDRRRTKLDSYAQLPVGAVEDKRAMEFLRRRLSHFSTQVYNDPDAVNVDSIFQYNSAKMSYVEGMKSEVLAASGLLEYQITEQMVSDMFYRQCQGRDSLGHLSSVRVEMIRYSQWDSIFMTVSAFASLLEQRLGLDNFKPALATVQSNPDKMTLLRKLEPCTYSNLFRLKGNSLRHVKVVFGWHGCRTSLISSIKATGFAAFTELDPGYFGHGNYFTLEPRYACGYAMGEYFTQKPPNAQGEYSVLLCACLTGFTYPVTPCPDDFTKLGSPHPDPKDCKWYGTPLKAKFNAHLTAIDVNAQFLCTKPQANSPPNHYHELVLPESGQILPLAVVWFKP